jgi:hypothetical protein
VSIKRAHLASNIGNAKPIEQGEEKQVENSEGARSKAIRRWFTCSGSTLRNTLLEVAAQGKVFSFSQSMISSFTF